MTQKRFLIYAETAEAVALRDKERLAGNAAVLRNPQFFNPSDFDKDAAGVYTDLPVIASAYAAAGIEVFPIAKEAKKAPERVEAPSEASTDASAPKKPLKRK